MNAKIQKTILVGSVLFVVILTAVLATTSRAYAARPLPFVGTWYATDWDGSDLRLVIAGPTKGQYIITLTDSYISYCGGGAGMIRGTGTLNTGNPNLLETNLHLVCFTTGQTLDFQAVYRYHPSTGLLSSGAEDGHMILWHKYGRPIEPPAPLYLIVNYAKDWVDGPYEAGHTAWVTVTESDGVTVKAHIELVTTAWPWPTWPDFGSSGFVTIDNLWIEGKPDILPGDWVYAWIDNGASANVQVGDISEIINLFADSIEGTINAPGIAEDVGVRCFRTAAPQPGA